MMVDLNSLLMVVALILSGLLSWVATLAAKKLGVSVTGDQQALLASTAKSAIFYAEEMIAKKYGLADVVGKGSEKLVAALNYVTAKLPGVDQQEVVKEIHAALGAAPGLGASGPTGEKQ